ncbi:MAG: cation diffusion facilitator family transporter [bacterium]
MADGSKTSVIAAIAGNSLVMIAKFAGFFMTGSGAMLSEAIHTLADLMNQVLLLIGIVRSGKAPDVTYQYGYGRERYVWALISAVGIFFLGCGVTVYHGVDALLHPHPVEGLGWALGVLTFAFIVEGIVLGIAFRGLWKLRGDQPFFEYLRTRADPSAVAVLLEDSAACLGVVIAMVTIGLTRLTGALWWDAIGSILIGLLLGAVAIWLVVRNKELLVGRSIPEGAWSKVREVLRRRSTVEEIVEVKSRVIDTETYDVLVTVEFDGKRFADRQDETLRARYAAIGDYEQFRAFAAQFADEVIERLGDEIDAIEAEIRAAVPEIKHIDIEPN